MNLYGSMLRPGDLAMGMWFEKWYPFLGGVVAVAVYIIFLRGLTFSASAATALFSAVISISAIAVGFIATAKSILFTIEKREIIEQLRIAGGFSVFIGYMLNAVHVSALLSIISAVCLLIDFQNPMEWHRWLLGVWFTVLVVSILACYRVIHILGKVLKQA